MLIEDGMDIDDMVDALLSTILTPGELATFLETLRDASTCQFNAMEVLIDSLRGEQ